MSTLLLSHLKASTPASMNCQYCGKIFRRDYNLRRHEHKYCPDRDNDSNECSYPKKFRDDDEESISSNESVETHASHDDDNNTSEDTESSIATENSTSSEGEIDPWTILINDAASKVREQYEDILQALLMKGHDEIEAKQEILPVFQKELADIYMNNLAWIKALKKDPIYNKIMATRDDYVNNDMFDPDKAIAAAVDKRKFLLKQLLENQGRFPEQ